MLTMNRMCLAQLPSWYYLKLLPAYFISDGRIPSTWNVAHILSTLYSFKKSKKKIFPSRFFAGVNIFNKNTVLFVIFSELLYFSCFLYYLLSRLTQIPFYNWCKCPNTETYLICIFLYSDQKKLRIWTLFMQWKWRIAMTVRQVPSNFKQYLHYRKIAQFYRVALTKI